MIAMTSSGMLSSWSQMRIVLDTSVVIAAFRSRRGASNVVLRYAQARRLQLLCSTALFLEYEAVLGRREVRAATGHSLADVRAVMSALAAVAEPVNVRWRTRPMLRDGDDEMVLETAGNGNADAIVTHNLKDFLPARSLGIEVLTPGAVVRRLRR